MELIEILTKTYFFPLLLLSTSTSCCFYELTYIHDGMSRNTPSGTRPGAGTLSTKKIFGRKKGGNDA
jgi:hypothetical protein